MGHSLLHGPELIAKFKYQQSARPIPNHLREDTASEFEANTANFNDTTGNDI